MSDEERAALFLDGGMSPEERADFEREMAARPALAALVAQWRANDERLRAAFDLPMPAGLAERLGLQPPAARSAAVVDFDTARARRENRRRLPARWTWAAGGAIAASLVAALSLGLVPYGGGDPLRSERFQVAMRSLPSLETAPLPGGDSVTPTLSFADGTGRFCREFALQGERPRIGVACLGGGRWLVEGTAPGAAPAGGSEIRTAGGEGNGLDALYRRLDAGDPLDPARERVLIARGWQEKGARRE